MRSVAADSCDGSRVRASQLSQSTRGRYESVEHHHRPAKRPATASVTRSEMQEPRRHPDPRQAAQRAGLDALAAAGNVQSRRGSRDSAPPRPRRLPPRPPGPGNGNGPRIRPLLGLTRPERFTSPRQLRPPSHTGAQQLGLAELERLALEQAVATAVRHPAVRIVPFERVPDARPAPPGPGRDRGGRGDSLRAGDPVVLAPREVRQDAVALPSAWRSRPAVACVIAVLLAVAPAWGSSTRSPHEPSPTAKAPASGRSTSSRSWCSSGRPSSTPSTARGGPPHGTPWTCSGPWSRFPATTRTRPFSGGACCPCWLRPGSRITCSWSTTARTRPTTRRSGGSSRSGRRTSA